MATTHSRVFWGGTACVVFGLSLFLFDRIWVEDSKTGDENKPSSGQSPRASSSKPLYEMSTEEVIELLARSESVGYIASALANRGAVQAIPVLEARYAEIQNRDEKQQLALALARLGASGSEYVDYLNGLAELAIADTRPFPFAFDATGRMLNDELRPEFLKWVEEHGVDPGLMASAAIYDDPGDVLAVAIAADERSKAVLRRGMLSSNPYIAVRCAQGLARIQDEASISLIAATAERTPAQFGELMALTLLFFESPEASQQAERLVQDSSRIDRARRLADEKGLDGVFWLDF